MGYDVQQCTHHFEKGAVNYLPIDEEGKQVLYVRKLKAVWMEFNLKVWSFSIVLLFRSHMKGDFISSVLRYWII